MEKHLIRFIAWIIATLWIGNKSYSRLIESRFPTLDCLLSEIVNQVAAGFKLSWLPMAPRYLFIESTSLCNLKCVMCALSDPGIMTRPGLVVSLERVRAILEANPKTRVAYLSNWGEPMLNKALLQIIALCRSRNILTVLTTNATLLSEDSAQALIASGIGVVRVSMDGVDTCYETIRKSPYQLAENGLNWLLAARAKTDRKILVEINCTCMPENDREAHRVEARWGEKVDYIHFQGALNIPKFASEARAQAGLRKPGCRQLYRSLFYLTDGSMVPCCADFNAELSMGCGPMLNAHQILNGEPMRQLRARHAGQGDLPSICRHCTQFESENLPGRRQSSLN